MDLVATVVFGVSKKLAFTKERFGKGNLDGMVFEYVISALHSREHICQDL